MTITTHSTNLQPPAEHNPTVKLVSGIVQGESTPNYDRYLGIPYAEAPIGKLRFQLPVPIKPWEGIFEALHYGSPVPQFSAEDDLVLFQCATDIRADDYWLTVNVWAPKNAHNAPVFVWIHGGSFVVGSTSEVIYDGDAFARDGIVYVNLNYRLGIEGFGVFPDAPNNRGIADQILALRWVQANISSFGGDPNNVTLGGQSAGSMSVGTIINSPAAKGLFQRAIMQSGAPIPLRKELIAEYVQEVADELGTGASAAQFAQYTPKQVVEAMTTVNAKPENSTRVLICSPIVDGELVLENPQDALTEKPSPVPLLIGYTACEFALWLRILKILPEITWESFPFFAGMMKIHPDIIQTYIEYYQPHYSAEDGLMHLISDYVFVSPIRKIIQAQPDRSYAYIFSWHNHLNDYLAYHALDLPFVFDHLDTPNGKKLAGHTAPQKLADQMHKAWVNFISTGNPGWELTGHPGKYYDFSYPLTATDELLIDPRASLLDIWDQI